MYFCFLLFILGAQNVETRWSLGDFCSTRRWVGIKAEGAHGTVTFPIYDEIGNRLENRCIEADVTRSLVVISWFSRSMMILQSLQLLC